MRIVLVKDLHAAELGLPYELGLLHPTGAILDDCLPEVEAKLLAEGMAVLESDWRPTTRAKPAPANKRATGPKENK